MNYQTAVALRDKLAIAISASQDWSPGFKRNRQQFKNLLNAEARLNRKLRMYFKELANDRLDSYVNWGRYEIEVNKMQAAKPVNIIVDFTNDDVGKEANIITKVVFQEILSAVTAGATAQITRSKIPVENLTTLVTKVASDRAADLATQMTQTTIDKVRTSIETSLRLGETKNEATDRLGAFIDDPAKAETVARTESANAWRRGVLETGKQSGAVSKTWHVEGDPCQICEPLDGVTVPIDDDFPGGFSGEDGAHVNCRCDQSINYQQDHSGN